MTRSAVRPLAFLAAVAVSSTLLGVTGAEAQGGAYYVATPVAQPTKTSLVTRTAAWRWQNGAFVAPRAPERDAVLCGLVARSAGQLSSFTVDGKPYDADALAKCNAKAG